MAMDMRDAPIPKATVNNGKNPERLTEKQFRAKVWADNGGRCRCTGEPLSKTDPDDRFRGEVCHLQSRGAHADRKTDPTNAILLSAHLHRLSDHRGNCLLRIRAVNQEAAVDARKLICFTLYDRTGKVVWSRIR